jgi:hypothetical protein
MFQKWGLVFVESIKGDEALRQSQIIEPLREKLEKDRQMNEASEMESRISTMKAERAEYRRVSKTVYMGKFLEAAKEESKSRPASLATLKQ